MNSFKKYISPILLLLAAVIWGFAFAAQKAASNIPPLTLGASRSLLAAIFIFAVIPALDKAKKSERRLISKRGLDFDKNELIGGLICGAFLSLATLFQQIGINDTDAGKASFITALYVVIVPIYGLFAKKRAPLNVWCGVLVAVVGFYFLCIDGSFGISSADLMVFASAFIFAFHIITIDCFSPKCDGVRMSCIQFAVSTVINGIFALIFESPIDFSAIGAGILPILFLGICSSGIAYTLQIVGQKGINPTVASVILSLESVFGVIGSAIFLKERLAVREYIGCIIVFAAVLLAQIDFKAFLKKQPAPEKDSSKTDDSNAAQSN